MKKIFAIILVLSTAKAFTQNTIPTTTCTGAMKINDSLNVQMDIKTQGNITSSGELVSKDTVRAEKDVLIDGNIKVGSDAYINGETFTNKLNIGTDQNKIELKRVTDTQGKIYLGVGVDNTPPTTQSCISNMPNNSMIVQGIRFASATNQNFLMYNDGASGHIEFPKGINADPEAAPYTIKIGDCFSNLELTYGNGFTSVGKNFEIGKPTRNAQIAFNMDVPSTMQKAISLKSGLPGGPLEVFNIGSKGDININTFESNLVSTLSPHALAVFSITKNREVFKIARTGEQTINIDNSSGAPITVHNSTTNKDVYLLNANGSINNYISGTGNIAAFNIIDAATNVTNFRVYKNGSMYCREIKITMTNFPDYVFEKDYKLLSLNEVEEFIKLNKHLPNVPSAKNIDSDGANIGELQKINFEKTEEIYLYLIEMNKRLDNLEHENRDLKSKIKSNK